MKRTAEERLFRTHMGISKHPDFAVFSGLTVVGESKVVDDIATACTDGWNKYYSRKFMTDVLADDKHLAFVVLHELIHQGYNHIGMWESLHKEDAKLANQAADYFVNLTIVDADPDGKFASMPVNAKGEAIGLFDAKYRGWAVNQIFNDLKSKKQGGNGGKPNDSGDDGSDGADGGIDSHEWGKGDKPDDAAKQIDVAIRQGVQLAEKLKQKGDGSANSALNLNTLLYPKKNWRELLREFVNSTCTDKDESTWRKPNRRYLTEDIYMPSMQGVRPEKLAVVFDTSGSVFGSHEAAMFCAEMAAIIEVVKPEKVVVMYVDTQVCANQVFEDGQFAVSDVRYAGGGGTDLEVAYNWLEKNGHSDVQCCVILTDGFTGFTHAPKFPVIWAMSTDIVAPYGMTIKIAD